MLNNARRFYEFGPFRVDPHQRRLLRQNQPVPLQPKAFDILLVLVENSHKVVLKDDLMKTVWPDTFVEESNLSQHIFVLRKTLGDAVEERRYIVTVPGRGYRFAQTVRAVAVEEEEKQEEQEEQIVVARRSLARVVIERDRKKDQRFWLAAGALVVATLVAAGLFWRSQRKPKLTEKDTVVLADFDNKTGDPVFDGTLRQGLSAQLAQSPFLNLLSDSGVAHTLSLMGRPKDAPLKAELGREVCQRTQSAAVLDGTIAQIGVRYLLTLKAVNCSTGELLASTAAEASDKNHVLAALGKIASETRSKLGESLASVEKYDVRPEEVTTPSLEALRAYDLAHQALSANRAVESVPLYKRAISLDPNFAMAYLGLGVDYFNLDETDQAAENVHKAYQLRDRVSQREKLGIEGIYYAVVERNFEAARNSYLLERQIYPRAWATLANLGVSYGYLGDYDRALASTQKALESAPGNLQQLTNVMMEYTHSNRLQEAEATAREAQSHNLDGPFLHACLYQVEFLKHDTAGMEREAAQVVGKAGFDDLIFYYESDTAAYGGQFVKARELTRRAADSASRSGEKETTAEYESEAAVREALVGNPALAKSQARNALALSSGRDVVAIAVIALAMAGDSLGTQLSDDLGKRFPDDTALKYSLLPSERAAAALLTGDSVRALTALAGTPYELGQTVQQVTFVLYPAYLRGEAYLAARQGAAAAAEFRKIVDHPGLVQNEPIGALAHLGLGRAYAMSHHATEAKTEYQNFLLIWKDADPDIPILKEAKAEYAKLQ